MATPPFSSAQNLAEVDAAAWRLSVLVPQLTAAPAQHAHGPTPVHVLAIVVGGAVLDVQVRAH